MSPHVPDDLLESFVLGDVGEQVAVHIADHLDDCPACLNHVAGIEPLSPVFALMDDPTPPSDLAEAILAEALKPEAMPITELTVGAGLLAMSAMIATGLGNPLAFTKDFAVMVSAMGDVGRVLSSALASSSFAMTALTLVALAAMAITLRLSEPQLVLDRRML